MSSVNVSIEKLKAYVERDSFLPLLSEVPSSNPTIHGRLTALFAGRLTDLRILDGRGRDHQSSFRRSFSRYFIPEFWNRIYHHIEWFPPVEMQSYRVHEWWDWSWKFWFLAEPMWRISKRFGGPFDLPGIDTGSADVADPVIVILKAKHLRQQ